jgi:hypothetical protein
MQGPENNGLQSFGRRFFGVEQTFSRIGKGQLGGKGAGLDLIRRKILSRLEAEEFEGFEVAVPTLTVLGTEVFELFIERNNLREIALSDAPDDRIAHAFQKASIPAEYVGDLRALIAGVNTPLAVRSSSLLEDALNHPFAGVYETKMIPNNQPSPDVRFKRLCEAIKFVYASAFFAGAKRYLRSVEQDIETERMAVVIQEVVGERRGDRFYPVLSGVGRSYNYYPSGHSEPEDGVVDLALGLGKQIVDGGLSWSFSPAYPKSPLPFNDIGDILKNTQREFWAVNMGTRPMPDPIHETEFLTEAKLEDAEYDDVISLLVSTYDGGSDLIRPGMAKPGPRILDFAPLLRGFSLPLNALVKRLLEISVEELGSAVEIEFAVEMGDFPKTPARFGFLQARPMMLPGDEIELPAEELECEGIVVASEQSLGNGLREDITDVVFLKPEVFEAKHTRAMVKELEAINRNLTEAGRQCILIGFGRWGSSDEWLGVPVDWGQISSARVIVEATTPDMITDMSQGSHFFHNVISFRVLYLSVKHTGPRQIDFDWLNQQSCVEETTFVKHVRLDDPLSIKVDGRSGRGVIRHD